MMAVMERNSWDDGGIALVLGFGAVNMLMCMLIVAIKIGGSNIAT